MGYIRHHAIIITGWDLAKIKTLRGKVNKIVNEVMGEPGFDPNVHKTMVSNILQTHVNGYSSFFVGPDGSKEGWETSDKGDTLREKIVALCESSSVDYAELFYGEDNGDSKIINHN